MSRKPVTVPLKWGVDGGQKIGTATVDLDKNTVNMQVLNPFFQELMGDPKNEGLFKASVRTRHKVVKEVVLFAVAGMPATKLEKTMSDTSNNGDATQVPTSSVEDTPAAAQPVSGSVDAVPTSSTDPATTNTDGTSTDTESGDGSVGPGNPTDGSEETLLDQGTVPVDTSDTESGDVQDPTQEESEDTSNTQTDIPTSTEVGDDPVNGTDASESSSLSSDETEGSMGIDIQEVPGSATGSSETSPSESGEVGDPEFPGAPTPQEPIWPTGQALPEGVEISQVEIESLLTSEDINHRFGFHKAAIEGPGLTTGSHADLRREFKDFVTWLNDGIPASREAALMFTALEEASMWAHKAIAMSDPLVEE